ASARTAFKNISVARCIEACLIGSGLLAISVPVFTWSAAIEGSVPALVYLPLPFLIWAAVRFVPVRSDYLSALRRVLVDLRRCPWQGAFASTSVDNVLSLGAFWRRTTPTRARPFILRYRRGMGREKE